MSVNIFGHQRGSSVCPRGPPKDFRIKPTASQGDFDIEKKRWTRVGEAIDLDDAATLRMLDRKIDHLKTKIIDDINRRIEQV